MSDGPIEVDRLIDEAQAGWLLAKIVALCAVAGFMDGYDIQAISVALPAIAEGAGRTPPEYVPAITASLFGMAAGAMGLSPLADRWGRRPAIIVLLSMVGLASLGSATASGIYDLAAWRLVTGLGIGACVPVASALIAEYSPRRRRAAMISLLACSIGIGALTAGAVAPNISAAFGWRGIFVVGGVLPLTIALIFLAVLPESLPMLLRRRPGDPRIAQVVARLSPGTDPARLVVREEAGARHSVLSLLSPTYRARTLLVWAVISTNLFVNYVIVSWLPSLMRAAGWPMAAAQRSIMFASLGGIVCGLTLSWAADRGRPILALATGYVAATVALALFPLVPATGPWWSVLIAVAGGGAFGSQFTLTSVSASYYPGPIRATGLGWTSAMGRAGSIIGPTVIAAVMAQNLPTPLVMALLTAPMAICAAGVTLLPWALRNGDEPPGLSPRLQTET